MIKKLYLKNVKKGLTVKEFTELLFLNKELDIKKITQCPYTYYDIKCNNIQYHKAYRSMEEILSIYRGYFPRRHRITFLKSILKEILQTKKGYFLYCKDANKWILNSHLDYSGTINKTKRIHLYVYNFNDSMYKLDKKGIGKYNMLDIYKLFKVEIKIIVA